MDPKPSEDLDRLPPSPSQEQLKNVIKLTDALSMQGSVSEVWRTKGYSVADKDSDDVSAVSISRLTDQGQRRYPDYPLAIVRIFKRSIDGRVQATYEVSNDKDKLRINKHERLTTLEQAQRDEEEKLSFKNRLPTMTEGEAIDSLHKIAERLEARDKEKSFERKTGVSYVDNQETQQVIDILTKL